MSREQANAYRKHRDATDPQGNLAWAARLSQKAFRVAKDAAARMNVEDELQLTDEEKVLWRLIARVPRKLNDLEHAGLLPVDSARGFFRGLVAADLIDILDPPEAKALIPVEIERLRREVTGAPAAKPTKPLRARVYRPDINGEHAEAAPQEDAVEAPAAPQPSPRTPPPTPAPRAALPPLTPEEKKLKAEIDAVFQTAQKQDPFQFLGVPDNADDALVRQAYVVKAREFHSDRVAGTGLAQDPDVQRQLDTLFKKLSDVKSQLGTADGRAAAIRQRSAPQPAADATKGRRPIEAQTAYRMADTFFKKNKLHEAEMHYRQAAAFDPDDARILTGLAWCQFSNPDTPMAQRSAEAKKKLGEIVARWKYGDAAYKLGLVLRVSGDEAEAQKRILEAARLDPHHTDAVREKRLFESRKRKELDDKKSAADSGLFGKLFKKDEKKKPGDKKPGDDDWG